MAKDCRHWFRVMKVALRTSMRHFRRSIPICSTSSLLGFFCIPPPPLLHGNCSDKKIFELYITQNLPFNLKPSIIQSALQPDHSSSGLEARLFSHHQKSHTPLHHSGKGSSHSCSEYWLKRPPIFVTDAFEREVSIVAC